MQQQVSSLQRTAMSGLSLVPSVFLADQSSACLSIQKLAEAYKKDMPSTFLDGSSLDAELDMWSVAMSSLASPLDTVKEALKLTNGNHCPQLHLLLHLFCTFPIISYKT